MRVSVVAAQRRLAMASSSVPSVSFRISRHTEDLAITLHALSQRLVALEQRLDCLDSELHQERANGADPEDLARLDKAESLLRDCRQLLESDSADGLEAVGSPGLAPFKASVLEAASAAGKENEREWDAA
jgi:uncharacterized membrane protein YccC